MTSSTPLVSVIIPCYNSGAWIAETIASVAGQPGIDLEIIVVDDGSSDDSIDIARRAGGESLRVFRQSHKGASQARNLGTAEARGAFLQYLDADDVLVADTLAEKVTALRQREADVAYGNWVRWERQRDGSFADGEIVSRTLGPRPDIDLFTDFWWPPGALLYRRTIVDRIGPWREDLPVIQDARFLLDAALQTAHFVHVDLLTLKYRVHGEASLSRRNPRAFVEDCYRNAADLHAVWLQDNSLDDARRRALIKVYGHLARSFFQLDRTRFTEVLGALRTLDPDFLPESPRTLRALSRIVGYERAEHVAESWRHLKSTVRGRVVSAG